MARQTMVPWQVMIDPGLREDLTAIAAAEGMSPPGLVRQILGRWAKRYAKRQRRVAAGGREVMNLAEKNSSVSLSRDGEEQ